MQNRLQELKNKQKAISCHTEVMGLLQHATLHAVVPIVFAL